MSVRELMSVEEANAIQTEYVCSKCFHSLWIDFEKGEDGEYKSYLSCPDCGEGQGYIKATSAVRIKSKDGELFRLAKNNLSAFLGLKIEPPKSAEQILKELGF